MRKLSAEDTKIIQKFIRTFSRGSSNNHDIARKLLKLRYPFPTVVFFQNPALTKLMLDLGCSIHACLSHSGKTALHLSVENLDVGNVKLLVQQGANVNAKDAYNRMPLHRFEIDDNDPDDKLEILKILIDNGASLTASSSKLRKHFYLNDPGLSVQSKLLSEGDIRTLRLLISYVDLLKKDEEGKTPLHHLIKNKNPGVLEVLRGETLSINAIDSDGRTALDIGVFRLDLEKVRFLLENGASPNNLDRVGNPALRYILINLPDSEKTRKIIELLLIYGMDLQLLMKNRENTVALGSAIDRDFDFAKLLLMHLARIESCGVCMNEFLNKKIKGNRTLEDHLDMCRRQLHRMKVTSVHEAVTLYKLLCDSEKKLIMYVRSEEFRLSYECVKSNKYKIYSYYVELIKVRVDRAIIIAKVKDRAANNVCRIVGLPKSVIGTIAYKIVDYLNYKDLDCVSKLEIIKNDH